MNPKRKREGEQHRTDRLSSETEAEIVRARDEKIRNAAHDLLIALRLMRGLSLMDAPHPDYVAQVYAQADAALRKAGESA